MLDAVAVAPHPDSAVIEPRVRALVRCGIAAIAAGLARRAHDVALRYARARIQGGVRIIEHGAVADMLAAMAVRSRTQCPGGLAALTPPGFALEGHELVLYGRCDACTAAAA